MQKRRCGQTYGWPHIRPAKETVNQELNNCTSHEWRLCGNTPKTNLLLMIIVILSTSGCATTGEHGAWPRLAAGSESSIKQKSVWIPLAAAAIFAATSADRDVSEWAVERQPLFGSTTNANNWSDWLSNGLVASALITSFAQRDDAYQPLLTDVLALGSAYAITTGIKRAADRTRPDDSNDLSLPSQHATSAFFAAQVSARNLSTLDSPYVHTIKASLFAFASASAWARIEAARHYPSDVLAGAAIGNFFAGIGNAFLGERQNVKVSYAPFGDGGELRILWLFR